MKDIFSLSLKFPVLCFVLLFQFSSTIYACFDEDSPSFAAYKSSALAISDDEEDLSYIDSIRGIPHNVFINTPGSTPSTQIEDYTPEAALINIGNTLRTEPISEMNSSTYASAIKTQTPENFTTSFQRISQLATSLEHEHFSEACTCINNETELLKLFYKIHKGGAGLPLAEFPHPMTLNLKNAQLNDSCLYLFLEVLKEHFNKRLNASTSQFCVISLDLSGNRFTSKALPFIREFVELDRLYIKDLNLSNNRIGDALEEECSKMEEERSKMITDLRSILKEAASKRHKYIPQINLSMNNLGSDITDQLRERAKRINLDFIDVTLPILDGEPFSLVASAYPANSSIQINNDETQKSPSSSVLVQPETFSDSSDNSSDEDPVLDEEQPKINRERVSPEERAIYSAHVQRASQIAAQQNPQLIARIEELVQRISQATRKKNYSIDELQLIREKKALYNYGNLNSKPISAREMAKIAQCDPHYELGGGIIRNPNRTKIARILNPSNGKK